MPKHVLTRKSKYTARQMFDMAADVAQYSKFLPLVDESETYDYGNDDKGVSRFKGRLLVKKDSLKIRETFISDVVADENALTIISTASNGPVKKLVNAWKFTDLPQGGSQSELVLEYEVKNLAMRLMISASSGILMDKLTEAFEKRADEL
ncbi:hypothetical protein MNBD_ALPHA08-879, partial [hydrothermal vent metagenome]